MNRFIGLLEKEIRQNMTTLCFILVVTALAVFALQGEISLNRLTGSKLEIAKYFIFYFLPLCGFVLAGNMIGGEFRHRTQLFLEGLPLPRWQMLTVKFLLGLMGLILISTLLIAVVWWQGRHSEKMTPNFAALLVTKAAVWTSFFWSLNFAFAFLGRYRIISFFLLFLVEELMGSQTDNWWPYALMDGRFAFERYVWPVGALIGTGVLSLLLTAFAYYLGCMKDTSVAAMLAQKMSSRERIVLSLFSLSGILIFSNRSSIQEETQAVHLPGSIDYEKSPVIVQVAAAVPALTPEEAEALKQWSEEIGQWLYSTAEWLGRESLPPLYLVHRRDYEAGRLDWEKLDSRQGGLVRLNLTTTSVHDLEIRQKLLHELLDIASHFRLRLGGDERGWVLDGFCRWWVKRPNQTSVSQPLSSLPSPDQLSAWMRLRDQRGEEEAGRIAEVGIQLLHEKSPDGCQAFLCAVLGQSTPHHSGVVLLEAWHNIPSLLKKHVGLDWRGFADQWCKSLASNMIRKP